MLAPGEDNFSRRGFLQQVPKSTLEGYVINRRHHITPFPSATRIDKYATVRGYAAPNTSHQLPPNLPSLFTHARDRLR